MRGAALLIHNNKAIQHVQTFSNIYKFAQDKAPSSPALPPKNLSIVSLQVIDPVEFHRSIQLHLIAPTTNGVQLFFSPQVSLGGYGYSSVPYQAPTYPGYTGPRGFQRPLLTEHGALLPIPGRMWAMCPAPRDPCDVVYAIHDPVVTNELAY